MANREGVLRLMIMRKRKFPIQFDKKRLLVGAFSLVNFLLNFRLNGLAL
jgi:hypothetical protein